MTDETAAHNSTAYNSTAHNSTADQSIADQDILPELRGLAVPAPASAFSRFRRRAGLMQGGRMLVHSQVSGFWLVLDTLLKRFFRAVPMHAESTKQNSTRAGEI